MSLVTRDERDGVLTLTLNDPDRRNALSVAMVTEFCDALEAAEQSADVGAVVVTGSGRAFCAGADLSHLGSAQREGLHQIYRAFVALAATPLFTVSAVNGPAVGAGLNMALAADVRIAGASARFDCRFLDLGLHPGGGHTFLLQRAVGPQVAAAMVLGGEVLQGERAQAVGLAWRCVSDDTLMEEATALASRAAGHPRDLSRRAKRVMQATASLDDHAAAVELEIIQQLWSLDQPEFAERLAAMQSRIRGGC